MFDKKSNSYIGIGTQIKAIHINETMSKISPSRTKLEKISERSKDKKDKWERKSEWNIVDSTSMKQN